MAKSTSIKFQFDSNGNAVMGQLTISAKELQKAVKAVQKHTKDTMSLYMVNAAAVTTALQGLGAAVSALTSQYNSFDRAMRSANTMAGKSATEFEGLKKQVKNLAKEVPVARDALADGLYQVISNGVPEDNWLEYLKASARSSVGGMADLGDVVKVTSTVIKNYGKSWEEATAIQDKIQLAAKNGVTSFGELAQALPRVTGDAATLGVSINELLATFSTLTGVTGNSAEVSTQLGAVFKALVKPTAQAAEMARLMGISFNAATIQSVGGLENFLQELDKSVAQYAKSSGMLEKEIYARLFGSAEALRALGPLTGVLADKFSENVGAMADSAGVMDQAFNEMASTGESKSQKLKNSIAALTDGIAKYAKSISPAVQFGAYFGQSIAGIVSVGSVASKVYRSLATAVTNYNIVQKTSIMLGKSARALLSIMPKSIRQVALALQMMATTSRKAAIAVNILKVAIKSLMAATAIGLVITAITTVIDHFTNKVDEAGDAANEARKEFEDWKRGLTDISGQTSQAIAKEMSALERLYKTATDEARSRQERLKAANELKKTYKDTFSNLRAEAIMAGEASKAYDSLKQSILETAKAKAIQNKLIENQGAKVDLELESDQIKNDLKEAQMAQDEINAALKRYWETAKAAAAKKWEDKELNAAHKTASDNFAPAIIQKIDLRHRISELEARKEELDIKLAAIDEAGAKLESYAQESIGTPTLGSFDSVDPTADKKTELQKIDDLIQKQKEKYITAEAGQRDAIRATIAQLTAKREKLNDLYKEAERPMALNSIADYDAEISYQQNLRSKANADNIVAIDKEIERLQKAKKAIEEKGKVVKMIDEIQTYNDLNAALQAYSDKLANATETDRKKIQAEIDKLNTLKQAWENALDTPGDLSSLDTLEKLSKARSYYERMMQTAGADEMPALQGNINAIDKKSAAMKRGVTLHNQRNEIAGLRNLSGEEFKIKIKSYGFDELTERIGELKKMLADTENPLSDAMSKDARALISYYEQLRARSALSFDTFKKGISVTGSLGETLGGMVSTMRDSNNAWEKGRAIIQGSINAYEQIMSLIKMVQMITQALGIAKQADVTATEEQTLATLTGAAATVAAKQTEMAAESADTTSKVSNAAAGFFSAHSAIPFVGLGIAAAAVAAMVATMSSLPKFAKGGIAYGPTVGMFGEYAGAANNPEVVAPLDRLRTLIQPAGFGDGKVEFEIDGRKLKGLLKKIDTLSSRS